jgi:hypothetical protein
MWSKSTWLDLSLVRSNALYHKIKVHVSKMCPSWVCFYMFNNWIYRIEEYDKKAIQNINFPFPMTWEEAVVNLVVFDMLRAN